MTLYDDIEPSPTFGKVPLCGRQRPRKERTLSRRQVDIKIKITIPIEE